MPQPHPPAPEDLSPPAQRSRGRGAHGYPTAPSGGPWDTRRAPPDPWPCTARPAFDPRLQALEARGDVEVDVERLEAPVALHRPVGHAAAEIGGHHLPEQLALQEQIELIGTGHLGG